MSLLDAGPRHRQSLHERSPGRATVGSRPGCRPARGRGSERSVHTGRQAHLPRLRARVACELQGQAAGHPSAHEVGLRARPGGLCLPLLLRTHKTRRNRHPRCGRVHRLAARPRGARASAVGPDRGTDRRPGSPLFQRRRPARSGCLQSVSVGCGATPRRDRRGRAEGPNPRAAAELSAHGRSRLAPLLRNPRRHGCPVVRSDRLAPAGPRPRPGLSQGPAEPLPGASLNRRRLVTPVGAFL